MSITEQFTIALKAFRELETELGQPHREIRPPALPPMPLAEQWVTDPEAFPTGNLLLGVAADGLPLLLNLYDPSPGSLLLVGDKGSGKTAFLQAVAYAADAMPEPGDVQFGVITHGPEDWRATEALPGCLGVWPADHASAGHFLDQLISWAESDQANGRTVTLLLIDGLDSLILSEHDVRDNLRWLINHGPDKRIWPIATFNAGRMPRFSAWLSLFGLLVYGFIRQANLADALTGETGSDLYTLIPGSQFSLRKPDGWFKFWIHALDSERSE